MVVEWDPDPKHSQECRANWVLTACEAFINRRADLDDAEQNLRNRRSW